MRTGIGFRVAAVIVTLFVFPMPVRGAEPAPAAYAAPAPAPERYAPLGWQYGDKLAPGFWYSETQILRVDARIRYLEEKAARECVDAQVTAAKGTGRWYYVAAGLAVGVALGYCAGTANHCGVSR